MNKEKNNLNPDNISTHNKVINSSLVFTNYDDELKAIQR